MKRFNKKLHYIKQKKKKRQNNTKGKKNYENT